LNEVLQILIDPMKASTMIWQTALHKALYVHM